MKITEGFMSTRLITNELKLYLRMKKIYSTDKAPAAIGPYSQAVEAGGFVFISGQIPLVPGTGELIKGGIREQTKQVLDNIGAILQVTGLDYRDVVKCTVFLADIEHFIKMNEVYSGFFQWEPPARAAFEVARLPKNALIEIEAIAFRS
jgi:2-iminobutanoate/2-iminopropanoate deaminase